MRQFCSQNDRACSSTRSTNAVSPAGVPSAGFAKWYEADAARVGRAALRGRPFDRGPSAPRYNSGTSTETVPMSLLVKLNLTLALCSGTALGPAPLITGAPLQKTARPQIAQHARLMMQTALATRGYTNKQIKPLLAARLDEEFLPQTVPAYSAT